MQIYYNLETTLDTVLVIFNQLETTHIKKNEQCVQLWHHDQVIGYNFVEASTYLELPNTPIKVAMDHLETGCYASICMLEQTDELLALLNAKIKKSGFDTVLTKRPSGLYVGHILECVPHPDSNKLNLCKVDIKEQVLDIVCGAKNARQGINVVVATDNTILYNGVQITNGKVMGIVSQGMLCSAKEIGISNHSMTSGILELSSSQYEIGEEFNIFTR